MEDDNDFGMSREDFLYREMNPQDPWYMGDRDTAPPTRHLRRPSAGKTPCRTRKTEQTHRKGPSRWPVKKQLVFGVFMGLLSIAAIGLISWLGHLIFD